MKVQTAGGLPLFRLTSETWGLTENLLICKSPVSLRRHFTFLGQMAACAKSSSGARLSLSELFPCSQTADHTFRKYPDRSCRNPTLQEVLSYHSHQRLSNPLDNRIFWSDV
jgi:hypothetical protein